MSPPEGSRLYAFPGQDQLTASLLRHSGWQAGAVQMRHFPDGETHIQVPDEPQGADTAILCQLHQPDTRILPLLLLAETLRDLGAGRVGLIAPYLAYMRQDKRFQKGEGITSHYFARLLSQHFDWLLTVDPHLHRIHALGEIYSIPARALTAVEPMARWIRDNIRQPLVIGPDSESEQWAARVAELAGCPWEVLNKTRHGDREVEISLPHVEAYTGCTPILVDDIISTGKTMMQAAVHLQNAGLCAPVCVAVHGVFADGAQEEMRQSGLQVVTSNSIADESNQIDLAPLIANGLVQLFSDELEAEKE